MIHYKGFLLFRISGIGVILKPRNANTPDAATKKKGGGVHIYETHYRSNEKLFHINYLKSILESKPLV